MRIYVKCKPNGDYHNLNLASAVDGFQQMGFEIIKYQHLNQIYNKVTEEDIVLDYIDQCNSIFYKFGKTVKFVNYPEILNKYLGRKLWEDTINHISANPDLWGIFVKPKQHKVFTGKVINSTADLVGCGNAYINYEVYCSEVLDIVYEMRGFVCYDKLIDLRPYKGDYHYHIDGNIVDNVLKDFREWQDRPMGCSLDFAVTKEGKTIFLEMNDGYALGVYGLFSIPYAKLISARWSQILEREDECKF